MIYENRNIINIVKKILVELVDTNETSSVTIEDVSDDEIISESPLLQFDSLKAIRMIVNMEQEFGFVVPDDELIIENFNTPKLICEYINKKLQQDGGKQNVGNK